MKITCFSDTHSIVNIKDICPKKTDVLICAGDIMGYSDNEDQLEEVLLQMSKIKATHKLFVPGNHDMPFDTAIKHSYIYKSLNIKAMALLKKYNIIFLHNKIVTIDGIKFGGTATQPAFCNWYFNEKNNAIRYKTFMKLKNVDVLITHCPPQHILDQNQFGSHCGDMALLYVLNNFKNLKYHIFGHIHQGRGTRKILGITFINCSVLDDIYKNPVKAITFKYKEKSNG